MSRGLLHARNLTASWLGYAANTAILLVLSPFVVGRLDPVAYGVWVLIGSLTGYLGLAELGVRAGLGRHVNYHLGHGDIQAVNGMLNTALTALVAMGGVLVLLAGGLGMLLGGVFDKVPPDLVGPARIALLLAAANLWLALMGSAFGQMITAYERFDWYHAIGVGVLAVRAGATVVALGTGGGLVALAGAQVVSSAVGLIANFLAARRICPAMRLDPRLAGRGHLRDLWGFSLWAFLGDISTRLMYWTDAILIMVLLGPAQAAVYAIGGTLVFHMRDVVRQGSHVFAPSMIQSCARQDWPALRTLFLRTGTMGLAVGTPLVLGLVFFGRAFLNLWMPPEYGASHPVMAILAVSQWPTFLAAGASAVFTGLHRVRLSAGLGLVQAGVNLVLSVALVTLAGMGLEGIAWGAFIPRVVLAVFMTGVAMRWIGLPISMALRQAGWRWGLLTGALALLYAGLSRLPQASWGQFLLAAGLAGGLSVALTLAILPTREGWAHARTLLAARFTKPAPAPPPLANQQGAPR